MALATQTNVATLMRKAIDRQTALNRSKFKLKQNQVHQIILALVRDKNSGPYTELLKVLRDCPISDENFKILFDDCTACVVLLGRELKPLVEVVCNVDWTSRDQMYVELYMRFLINLVTAHTYHSPLVMMNLVKQFKGVYRIYFLKVMQYCIYTLND